MRKKFFWSIIFVLIALVLGFLAYDGFTAVRRVKPPEADVSALAAKEELTEVDYAVLLQQTGLGKPAIDDLKASSSDFAAVLKSFQEQLQQPLTYQRRFLLFPTTTADVLTDSEGRYRTLLLPPLRQGDILVTKSTKTLLYRHGHAAVLLDAEQGLLAEAMMLGSLSDTASLEGFSSFATVMILRPRLPRETIDKAISFTQEQLLHIPYNLFTGIVAKNKAQMERVDSTQCAHLVWQAYRSAGADIDADGGWLVTPKDLSKDADLELVFSFGFGEQAKW